MKLTRTWTLDGKPLKVPCEHHDFYTHRHVFLVPELQ